MRILALALKDLKLLLRDRMAAFFILGFPVLMGLFFGMVMGGSSSGDTGKMKVAVVDQDQSDMSKKFSMALGSNSNLQLQPDNLDSAMESVRLGKRTGMILIPSGFGETAGMIGVEQVPLRLGLDPSRTAESAMLEGFIMQASAELIQERFKNPRQFLPNIQAQREDLRADESLNGASKLLLDSFFGTLETMIDSAEQITQDDSLAEDENSFGFSFAKIEALDVSRKIDPNSVAAQTKKIRSKWDISFPQAMLWGVMGCVAGFSTSIARERTAGTMIRLQASPLNRFEILLGKALACFITTIGVVVMMVALGLFLGMRPNDYPKLLVATLAVGFCFVGIMMTFSVLGKSEQSVAGIGWALNMVMAMFGGAMIPAMFMPSFLQRMSSFSPVRWAIHALEGSIWREFTWAELFPALAILLAIGATGMLVGSTLLSRRQD